LHINQVQDVEVRYVDMTSLCVDCTQEDQVVLMLCVWLCCWP